MAMREPSAEGKFENLPRFRRPRQKQKQPERRLMDSANATNVQLSSQLAFS
jgi:hypothetical protein